METKEIVARLLNRAYHYLGYRARTSKEIQEYIKKKMERYKDLSVSQREEIIQNILNILSSYNLINDKQFVDSWIRDRSHLKPRGEIILKQELLQKGVSKNIIDNYFSENQIDESALASQALKKREKALIGIDNDKKKFEKAMNYLMRRGFSYTVSKKAFEELFKKG